MPSPKWNYKLVKTREAFCSQCDTRVWGNGSFTTPYKCDCGLWKYDYKTNKYISPNQSNNE